jgi:succinate dehydrogenase hydrophobic anchor subunit
VTAYKWKNIFQAVLVVFACIMIGYCVDAINFAAWYPFVKPIVLIVSTWAYLLLVLIHAVGGWIFV